MKFQAHTQADGTTRYWEVKHQRYVDPGYYLLIEAQAAGEDIPTVPYVAPPPPPDPQASKPADLKAAENRFVSFCRSLGLPDVASTAQLEQVATSLPELQGLQVAVRALALINDVTQNGGTWDGIAWHEDVA